MFNSFQYICGGNESITHVQYKVAGAQNAGFGRALMQGDSTCLLSENTDLQPVRDGKMLFFFFFFVCVFRHIVLPPSFKAVQLRA